MPHISNKDLDNFGIVINTLVNENKKLIDIINEKNTEFEEVLKNFQILVRYHKQLPNEFEKLIIQLAKNNSDKNNEAINFQNQFNLKLDEIRRGISNTQKVELYKKYSIMAITICFLSIMPLAILYNENKPTYLYKETLKYKLLIKLSKPGTRKRFISLDSIFNTMSISELEERMLK